jgi:serine/threonine protein kinase
LALAPGTRLGQYEIVASLGAGGMGEVYRARDTRLGRDVALKILPELFVSDADRVARFQREAQVLASLNHPNIATIHGFEEIGAGPAAGRALVMELVDGPTLADRIVEGAIPIDEALPIARQIADALDAAHAQGIVHRDLKPANIKLRPDGTVKVLDYGLAKAMAEDRGAGPTNVANSPTLTARATEMGMILGTAAYMAPEQARGKSVDKRADIWAFGCVLFEMLVGQRVFIGEDMTETLASVVKEQPNIALAPAKVQRLLRKCLEKDPRRRLRDIGDAWELLEDAPQQAGDTAAAAPARARASRLPWIVAAAAGLAAIALAVVHFRQSPVTALTARFEITWPTSAESKSLGGAQFFQLSPDGRYLALVAQNSIWVRPIDSVEATRLDRTQGATYPFWSPDSETIGFFQDAHLRIVPRGGGAVRTLCDAPDGRGAAWSTKGTIVFSDSLGGQGLSRVADQGGTPVRMTVVADAGPGAVHRYPQFLPDGDRFLFLVLSPKASIGGIYVGSLSGSAPIRILEGQENALFVSAAVGGGDGYLLFRNRTALMASVFDSSGLKTMGAPFLVAPDVGLGENTGLAAFSVARNGTLAYSGENAVAQEVVWLDRSGQRQSVVASGIQLVNVALSPDERRVAISVSRRGVDSDIWLIEPGGSPARFTFGPAPGWSSQVWSPKGDQIAYATSDLAGLPGYEIRRKHSNGAGVEETLMKSGQTLYVWDWSTDGKSLVISDGGKLELLPVEGDHTVVPLVKPESEALYGQLSPNGRWIAYTSGNRGQAEVYVQPVPATGSLRQVSQGGGMVPRWRRDGRELYYRATDGRLMAVGVSEGPDGSIQLNSTPQALFPIPSPGNINRYVYAPAASGQRFLVGQPLAGTEPPLTLVLNWTAAVKH